MTEVLLRMLLWATLGLALVLVVRRPARRVFGAGPAFTLWLLPAALALAALLPRGFAPAAAWSLPTLVVTPHVGAVVHTTVPVDWTLWLAAIWMAGAAIGLLRLAAHYVRLLHGMRGAPAAWSAWLAHAAPGMDPRHVRVHPAGPAVLWALPRTLVLLPADFPERFDHAATRELVLRHEFTHLRRSDAWWTVAMEIASALLWFHPLAWLARPRFRLDQELACDAAALRVQPQRSASYAHALLDSAAVRPVRALIPWLAEPQLKERIAMITRTPPGALRRRAGFLAIAVLLGGGLMLAGGQTAVAVQAAASGLSASTPPSVDTTYKADNPPRYPPNSMRNSEQGTVMLRVRVDADGSVSKVEVDQAKTTTDSAELQAAAVTAAEHWKFNPGEHNGRAVGGWVKIPVRFSLDTWSSEGKLPCPPSYRYNHGSEKAYTCEPQSAAPASS